MLKYQQPYIINTPCLVQAYEHALLKGGAWIASHEPELVSHCLNCGSKQAHAAGSWILQPCITS